MVLAGFPPKVKFPTMKGRRCDGDLFCNLTSFLFLAPKIFDTNQNKPPPFSPRYRRHRRVPNNALAAWVTCGRMSEEEARLLRPVR